METPPRNSRAEWLAPPARQLLIHGCRPKPAFNKRTMPRKKSNNNKMSQLQRQIADLRQEISPLPLVRGGMMTTSNRMVFVRAKITKSIGSGNIGLNDIADFNNANTVIDKISLVFPPYHGGTVTWKPGSLMPEITTDNNTTRIVVPRSNQQKTWMDLPDAHMVKLSTTDESAKFLEFTIYNSLNNSQTSSAFLTVHYRTKVNINL